MTSTQSSRTLGVLLMETRKKRGLSRAQLSKLSGVNVSTITKYEVSGQTPTADKLALLCLHLHLDPRHALLHSLGDTLGPFQSVTSSELWHAFELFLEELQNGPPDLQGLEKRLRELEVETREQRLAMVDLTEELVQALLPSHLPIEDAGRFMFERGKALRERIELAKFHAKAKSGSDQKDPSRPIPKSKAETAAGTASKRPRKGGRLDEPDNDGR